MCIATYCNKDFRQLKSYPKEKTNRKWMGEKKETMESGHKIEF